MKKTIFILSVFLLHNLLVEAQNSRPVVFGKEIKNWNPETGVARCASTEYEAYLKDIDPNRATTAEFEAWLAPKIEALKTQYLANRNSSSGNVIESVITIPVVVHVIHNGDAVNSGENISNNRIISQITVLNQDFRRQAGTPGFNTNPVGADTEIQFCLAQRDPNNAVTNGINRVQFSTASWNQTTFNTTVKPATQWDPTKYLNIWVCRFTDSLQLLGYAQFPSTSGLPGLPSNGGAANTDGVVIDFRCFGSSVIAPATTGSPYYAGYDRGRTTTHEVGHYLGLRHIWGDGGSQQAGTIVCTASDFCADTPPAGWDNYECTDPVDTCFDDEFNDMVENYMDYTNDTCMNIFTQDQKFRMLTVLQNSPRRSTLGSSNGCINPLSNSEFEVFENATLYPNPAKEYVTITLGDTNYDIDSYILYNSLGQIMDKQNNIDNAELNIETENLAKGLYFVVISNGSSTKTLKFLKN